MPTFHFYKNKKKITELKGSDPLTLEKKIQELSTSVQEDNHFVSTTKDNLHYVKALALTILVSDQL